MIHTTDLHLYDHHNTFSLLVDGTVDQVLADHVPATA